MKTKIKKIKAHLDAMDVDDVIDAATKCGIYTKTGKLSKRYETKLHRSHKMTEWRCEVRAPAGEGRFYSVRSCRYCEHEEIKHAAGHFTDDELLTECK